MKICHILWSLTTGGIETMLVDIINRQVAEADVMLVVVNDLVDPALLAQISPDCRIRLLRRPAGSRNPLSLVRLNAIVERFAPDVIHHHSPRTSKVLFTRRPMVRTIHATDLAADEYARMDALYAISGSVRDFTAAQGFESEVIINGIPVDRIAVRAPRTRAADGTLRMVQVGRVCFEQKGQDLMVQAMDTLVNGRGLGNLRLHIIGEGEDLAKLRKMVEEKGLTDKVVLEGLCGRDYVFGHLRDFDLFVQPSRQEGFGLTVAEACAACVPVLTSDLAGPLEIIDGGRLGATFRAGDATDLADKIEAIYRGGYDPTMIEAARRRVTELYDVGVTARAYLEAYRKIV